MSSVPGGSGTKLGGGGGGGKSSGVLVPSSPVGERDKKLDYNFLNSQKFQIYFQNF